MTCSELYQCQVCIGNVRLPCLTPGCLWPKSHLFSASMHAASICTFFIPPSFWWTVWTFCAQLPAVCWLNMLMVGINWLEWIWTIYQFCSNDSNPLFIYKSPKSAQRLIVMNHSRAVFSLQRLDFLQHCFLCAAQLRIRRSFTGFFNEEFLKLARLGRRHNWLSSWCCLTVYKVL